MFEARCSILPQGFLETQLLGHPEPSWGQGSRQVTIPCATAPQLHMVSCLCCGEDGSAPALCESRWSWGWLAPWKRRVNSKKHRPRGLKSLLGGFLFPVLCPNVVTFPVCVCKQFQAPLPCTCTSLAHTGTAAAWGGHTEQTSSSASLSQLPQGGLCHKAAGSSCACTGQVTVVDVGSAGKWSSHPPDPFWPEKLWPAAMTSVLHLF